METQCGGQGLTSDGEPGTELGGRLLPSWQRALPAPFAQDPEAGRGLETQGAQGAAHQFRDASPGGKGQMEQSPSTPTQPDAEIGRVEPGVQVVHREMADAWAVGPLVGKRAQTTAVLQERRDAIGAKAPQGWNRRQSDMAGMGAVPPLGFQMVTQREPERGIDGFALSPRGRDLRWLTGARAEQLEGRGLAVTRGPTGTALPRESLPEAHGAMGGHSRPHLPPKANASPRMALSALRWGVCSRYQ
jgi:hypothetical protein